MAQNPLDPTGRAILTQVAFKGAVEAASASGSYNEGVFNETFPVFTETLVNAVTAQNEEYFEIAIAKKAERIADGTYTQDQAADIFADEFGATQAPASAGGVRVKGKQHGPLPEWLGPMAAAKGVTEVWDNRDSIAGTKKPHFKATNDDVPFWPPR